ncbi:MAG: phosphatidate cytidylyltransferase [Steroidobacteraceae bacterium]|nr:phosphatidate cytidylyltransferase [Steroidobacteraceae bacterium]MCC7199024.1 phosphatidate cytidylyltransferase [Gammaproteobacteria bacterium]
MLLQRILTAIVLAAVLALVLLALPASVGGVCLTILLCAGAWEWSAFAGQSRAPGRLAYVAAVAVAMALLWQLAARNELLVVLLWVTLAWWVCAFAWMLLAHTRVTRLAAGVAGVLTLAPAWLALVTLNFSGARGPQYVLFAFLLVGCADVGAYFAGRKFGHTKLAPKISPGKTWEGVLGGFVLSAVAATGGAAWFDLPAAGFLPLCAAVVAISIVGDLSESMFKRAAGLKDSGRILPGHGGVLDRIDSLSAGAPLLLLGLTWLGAV